MLLLSVTDNWQLNLQDILSVFMVLFAVIDIFGSIPIIIDLKQKTGSVNPGKTTVISFLMMIGFLFLGKGMLNMFSVDISSFAIAGSLVLFFLALEMVLGIELFKTDTTQQHNLSIVPLAFPLIAGAGSFTALLSLRSEYSLANIIIAVALNMIVVYTVLKLNRFFERLLGVTGVLILRKIFGVILLAIAIKLFVSNTGIKMPIK